MIEDAERSHEGNAGDGKVKNKNARKIKIDFNHDRCQAVEGGPPSQRQAFRAEELQLAVCRAVAARARVHVAPHANPVCVATPKR